MATNKFTGIPENLLPAFGVMGEKFQIVEDGPRDLYVRPFDYRNPSPLKSLVEINGSLTNGANTLPDTWPASDSVKDFDYYINDNAALGLPGGPECALVDIYGTLRGYTGAWAFGIGEGSSAPDLRVRRLVDGHLPIVQAGCGGCAFEYFAAEIPDAPICDYPVAESESYRWVGGMQPRGRNIFLSARCRFSGTLHLGFAERYSLCSGSFYSKPAYTLEWKSVELSQVSPGVYRLTADGYTLGMLTLQGAEIVGEGRIEHWPQPLPESPGRDAEYYMKISGSDAVVDWVIPFFPLATADDACLFTEHDALYDSAVRLWRERRMADMQISIPEAKVQDAYTQSLNHLDICRVALDRSEFPTPVPSGGHHIFFERDSVDLIYAYDILGEHGRAERMIEHYRLFDVQQESSGMALWLMGKHLAITKDSEWAKRLLPEAIRRMSWLMKTWTEHRSENDGLLPSTTVPDNELIVGHFVSYHLYALAGARSAVAIAKSAGDDELAVCWKEFCTEFGSVVMEKLAELVEKTDGVLTPGFEGFDAPPATIEITITDKPYSYSPAGAYGATGGNDWHNLGAAFPTEVLPADHPWITSSLERWRHAYTEGIFPYPDKGDYRFLHNYNTMNLSETWLRRGDYAETLRDLYGLLLHTSGTHASAEVVDSGGRRDANCTPHNWFSAKFVRFVRDLLVYEEGRLLHIMGCLSPAWLQPGMVVSVQDVPTELGTISFTARMQDGGFDMELAYEGDADGIVLHTPPFLAVKSIVADGVAACDVLPPSTRRVQVGWTGDLPEIDFERVVSAYIRDYQKRVSSLEDR